ncbi:MAG: BREX system P-loop protein BrxC [Lachnospirales bacterium]
MQIKNMFEKDITRSINGVIKVAQNDEESLKQELSEYVVTKELEKHFHSFFHTYSKSANVPTNNIGVWISGFYGSGKSHFLKILSYILANKIVDNKKSYEYFHDKFEDTTLYSTVKQCTDMPTETILFNIDAIGGTYRDNSAILRVFAKAFYNHLGYYGEDLKIVRLESYVAKQGKTEEFKKVFKEIHGDSWEENRNAMDFFEDEVVQTLVQVLGISESSATNWINTEKTIDISVEILVQDIKEYIDTKEDNFRLLFMIDEVGQYINTNISMKLNLQTIVEQLGSICAGKSWVIVTSQEAIDTFASHSNTDFSGIMGRFNTKLSLTSSSADEVIKKRILKKNDDANDLLTMAYKKEHSVLKNLFSFDGNCTLNIKGFKDSEEYTTTYPFIPYQFIIIQKVFDAIRTYGIASKHQSSGERSLLECYQIATLKIKEMDENTLVPFYYFYDTVSNSLDTTVRRVIDRCEKTTNSGDGIEKLDINILKLLYLIRYIDDIPSNIDNIAILMITNIDADKIIIREEIKLSLERLIRSNYVARNGDKYSFLTDDEQKVARDIAQTEVSESDIRNSISETIYGEIYPYDKCKYNKYDFIYDKYIDSTIRGKSTNGVRLRIVTATGDLQGTDENQLIFTSDVNNEAIVVLSEDTFYYDELRKAMQILKFIKQRSMSQLPENERKIVDGYQKQSVALKNIAKEYIEKSIIDSKIYINGEKAKNTSNKPKDVLDKALKTLIESVYTKLSMVNTYYESDSQILEIINRSSNKNTAISGTGVENEEAIEEVSQWLELQNQLKMPVSMGEVQSRFQSIPYGWGEREIAGIVAKLILQQKVEVRYGGAKVSIDDRKLVDYLRKRSEIDSVKVIRIIPVDEKLIRDITKFYREYLGNMSIPAEEIKLSELTIDIFRQKLDKINVLLQNYNNYNYPDKDLVVSTRNLINNILSKKNDNTALFNNIVKKQDDLLDAKEDMEDVETFFRNQRDIFDKSRKTYETLEKERNYFASHEEIQNTLKEIIEIIREVKPYKSIKNLPELMVKANKFYDALLETKKTEVTGILTQCMSDIHTLVDDNPKLKDALTKADNKFSAKKTDINDTTSLTFLDAFIIQLMNLKDAISLDLEKTLKEISAREIKPSTPTQTPTKVIKNTIIRRYDLLNATRLNTKEDIDSYVEGIRKNLYNKLKDNDVIQIS